MFLKSGAMLIRHLFGFFSGTFREIFAKSRMRPRDRQRGAGNEEITAVTDRRYSDDFCGNSS